MCLLDRSITENRGFCQMARTEMAYSVDVDAKTTAHLDHTVCKGVYFGIDV